VSRASLSSFCVSRSNPWFRPLAFPRSSLRPDRAFRHSRREGSFLSKEFNPRWRKNLDRHRHQPQAGQRIIFTADGHLRYSDAKADNGPDGLARAFKDLIRILPIMTQGRGALIGRVG